MTTYRFPFPLETITLGWGVVDKEHPNGHRGTDFAPEGGGTIRAVSDGVVVRVEYQSGLGWVVSVRDDDGVFWHLSHLAERPPVNVGDRVSIDVTPVGDVGDTGTLTTGRHLHFSMSLTSDNPATGSTFDPVEYISARLTTPRKTRSTDMSMGYIDTGSYKDGKRAEATRIAIGGENPGTGSPNWIVRTNGKPNAAGKDLAARLFEARGVGLLEVTTAEFEALGKEYTTKATVQVGGLALDDATIAKIAKANAAAFFAAGAND